MIRRILIGLDGSSYSNAALELAVDWSKKLGCTLVGMGVIDHRPVVHAEPAQLWPNAYTERTEAMVLEQSQRRVQTYLDNFIRYCCHASVPCDIVEVMDQPEECLPREAEKVDLLMLGSQTFFHSEKTPDSENSVLRAIVRQSPRPVVTVPTVKTPGQGVVVAYDGSIAASHALHAFQSSGLDFGEKVHVLSVGWDECQAADIAYRAVEYLRSHEVQANALPIVSHLPVGKVLLHRLTQLQPRLVVMGAFTQSVVHERVLGSVTHAILESASFPMFLHH